MSTVKIAGLQIQLQAVVDGDEMMVEPLQPITLPVQPEQVAGVLAALGTDIAKVTTDLARSYDRQKRPNRAARRAASRVSAKTAKK
jgi:hypothetical protein